MKTSALVSIFTFLAVSSCHESEKNYSTIIPKRSVHYEVSENTDSYYSHFVRSSDYTKFVSAAKGARQAVFKLDSSKAKTYRIENTPIIAVTIPIINGGKRYIMKGNVVETGEFTTASGRPRDQMEIEYFNNVQEINYFYNESTGESMSFIKILNGTRRYWPDGYEEYYMTVSMRTIDNQYNIGGKRYSGHSLVGFVDQDIPDTYLNKPKYKNFNACYQAKKAICESDWLCDAACSIAPCWMSYIAACVYEQYLR